MSFETEIYTRYADVRKRLWGRPLMMTRPPVVRHMPIAPPLVEEPEPPRPLPFIFDVVEEGALSSKSAVAIIREVCAKHNISLRQITGSVRVKAVIAARREACWRIRNETLVTGRQISLAEIGRRMGGWDHTTVLHHVRTYQAMVDGGEA